MSLLPHNSTKLERAAEEAMKYAVDPGLLPGFKFDSTNQWLQLALSWEYSLAQVNVDDFRERVLKGLEFHRLRGTPISLRNALSWYGFDNVVIEEEPPGEHFSEFQIGIEEIPNGFMPDPVINVAAFAAPLRSRLSRMYNDLYDERRLIADNSLLDEGLLSDDSGIRLKEDGPKLSFGRVNNHAAEIPIPTAIFNGNRERFIFVKNVDTSRLDFAFLDDAPSDAINWKSTIERNRTAFNHEPMGEIPNDLFGCRRLSIASIILSEDDELDDLNVNFCGGYDESDEMPFALSFGFLSENKTTVKRIIVDERLLREKCFRVVSDFDHTVSDGIRERERLVELEYAGFDSVSILERSHSAEIKYKGADTWRDHRHFCIPWNRISEYAPILNVDAESN
jgi:hypothetical protein